MANQNEQSNRSNHTHRAHQASDLRRRFESAIVDATGKEVPITEQMIQHACEALERQAQIGLNAQSPRR